MQYFHFRRHGMSLPCQIRDEDIRDAGAMARQFHREYMQIVRLLPEVCTN
jgi:hypothetical protein